MKCLCAGHTAHISADRELRQLLGCVAMLACISVCVDIVEVGVSVCHLPDDVLVEVGTGNGVCIGNAWGTLSAMC